MPAAAMLGLLKRLDGFAKSEAWDVAAEVDDAASGAATVDVDDLAPSPASTGTSSEGLLVPAAAMLGLLKRLDGFAKSEAWDVAAEVDDAASAVVAVDAESEGTGFFMRRARTASASADASPSSSCARFIKCVKILWSTTRKQARVGRLPHAPEARPPQPQP